MDYHVLLTNTAFATMIVGIITAIMGVFGGYLAARAQKAPDVQTSITAAVAGIMKHYQDALTVANEQTSAMRIEIEALHRTVEAQTETISRLEQTVQGQTETIGSLETHIDELTALMKQHGVSPPPRRSKA